MTEAIVYESDLPDLTDIPLVQLPHVDESVFAQALRRVAEELSQPQDAVAGFQNAIV